MNSAQSEALQNAYKLLRQLFPPILALRIVRDGRTVGAYLLAGDDHSEDPLIERARLEKLGEQLLRILEPPTDFVEAVTRQESMRRLSWFSHQINGPIGRADAALKDIQECLKKNPTAAALLAPDEEQAASMAAMARQPLQRYQIRSRLETVIQAINDLRRISYQIRQLRRIQANLNIAPCRLLPIIEAEIQRARETLPNLRIHCQQAADREIEADRQFVGEAFQEVFNNSIRELKFRKTDDPTIDVTLLEGGEHLEISIRDNGLPALTNLIDSPFEEESSTYARHGQGSGLGLNIVREIMIRHGGTCSLTPNCDSDGERVPGVTFTCTLPLFQKHSTNV